MKHLLLAVVLALACDDDLESGATSATPEEAEPPARTETETEAETEAEAETEPAEAGAEAEPAFVSATGLTIHRSLRASSAVLRAARQDRPSTIASALAFGAGDEGAARVHWLAFDTSRFDELRGRAADEGRIEAFDADLERRVAACEAQEEVGDCDFCHSRCDSEVSNALATRAREVILVRVTERASGSPRVDGSQVIYRGDQNDDLTVRIREVEDLDGDGRLEISLAISLTNDWSAGDGGHEEERHVVVDADRLNVQLDIRRKRVEDGHGGGVEEESRVSFQDRNGDARADYALRYTRTVMLNECAAYPEEELPETCRDRDETRRAHYSVDRDAWVLAEGETWPWL